jgi:peptide/nickel transport system substrate-binding protein
MRMRIVGGFALVLASVTALAACSGSSSGSATAAPSSSSSSSLGLQGQYGSVPAEATGTEHSGTITVAAPPNSAPTWILPMITAADNSVYDVYEFDQQMYRPLYWLVNGVEPTEDAALSLASDPVWSDGDTSVSFTLKSSAKWSNGKPLTSQDVLFWYYMLKAALKESPANWAFYTPGLGIPDEVASVTAPNATTVTMKLTKAVNPTWFWENMLGTIQPMPSQAWDIDATGGKPVTDWATNPADATKIYNYLSAASKSVSTYASNPLWQVVDGPYKLSSFTASSGAFTMVPNPAYGGPGATTVSTWQSVPFTSDAAEFNALKSGTVDVGYVPLNDVPQASSIASTYNEFGYPDFGWTFVVYNFKDTTDGFNNIIDKLYMRQALAHLENEPGYVKAFFYGAAGQGFGPIPEAPQSPYTPSNASTNPYPYSPSAAAAILKANGWTVVPNGTDTCAKPGTGAGECGAGITAGQKLAWNVIYGTDPSIIGEQVQDWASEAKTVGITMNLSSSNFNYMIENYNDPAAPKTINNWAMEDFGGETNSTYPTTYGVFNSTGSGNLGGYDDPKADSLISASISSPNASAVTAEAQYLTAQQPSLFQPDVDDALGTAGIVAWQKDLSGPAQSFQGLTQASYNPDDWFFTK